MMKNKKLFYGILVFASVIIGIILISGCVEKPTEEISIEKSAEEILVEKPIEEPQPTSQELPEQAESTENLTETLPQDNASTKQEEIVDEDSEEEEEREDDEDFIRSENWRSEIVDDTGWVGIDPSIAVDADGNPHISHYDQGNRDLKYARWTGGSWQKVTVDSEGDVGEESGIAVDSDGNPHISYIDAANGGLKYARRKGNSWSIETVDQTERYHAVTTSIALDASDYPHIVYNIQSGDGGGNDGLGDLVKYAYWDGSSWNIETVSTNGIDVYLALDSKDNPHVCFVRDDPDDDTSRIYYATGASGSWSVEIVDPSTLAGGDCGIAIDSNNYPRITYHDYGIGAIKYASWDGTSWNTQIIAMNVGSEEGLKMVVDARNNPHIIYSDSMKELLMYATWNGISWTKETVNRMGNPSIAIDNLSRVHVSHGYTVDGVTIGEETEILKYSVRG